MTHHEKSKKELIAELEEITKKHKDLEASLRDNINEEAKLTLLNSEKKLRKIYETIPDSIHVVDKNGIVVYCNTALLKLHGFQSKDEIIGKHYSALFPDYEKNRVLENNEKIINNSTQRGIMYDLIKSNGTIFPAEISAAILHDENDNAEYLISITHDITKQKKAEAQIIKESLRFQNLFNNAAYGIAICKMIRDSKGQAIDFKHLQLNEATKVQTGFDVERLKGKKASDLVPQNEVAHYVGLYENVLKTGNSFYYEEFFPIYNRSLEVSVFLIEGDVFALQFLDTSERVETHQKIRNNEKELNDLLNNLKAGVVVHEPDTSIKLNNAAASELLGLSFEQMNGKKAIDLTWNFIREDDTIMPLEEYPVNRVITSLIPISNQVVGVNRPNKKGIIWLLVNGFPVFNDKLELKEVIINFLDITDRKIAQEELTNEKRFLETVFENLSEGIVACDSNGILTRFNQATKDFHGLPEKAIPANEWSNYYNLFLPDGITPMKQEDIPLYRALKDGKVTNAEMMIIPENGIARTLVANGQTIKDPTGNVLGAVVAMHDISDRKKAEESIKKLSLVVDQNTSIVVITDVEGNIEYVNPKFTEVTGYSFSEIMGKTPRILKSGETSNQEYERLWETIKSGNIWKGEFHNRKKNGELYYEKASIFPLINEKEEIINFVAIKEDITIQKETEEALILSNNRYLTLFAESPIPLWEEDFSEVHQYLNQLKNEGVSDFRTWFDMHSEEVMLCAKKIIIVDVNRATLELYHAKNKEELLGNLDKTFTENSWSVFKEELIAIAEGKTEYEVEAEVKTLTNEIRHVHIKLKIDETLSDSYRALLATSDITVRKQAEIKLAESEHRFSMLMLESPMVIEIYDKEGLQIAVNKAYEKLWEFPASQTLYQFNVLKSEEVEKSGLMTYIKKAYDGESITVPDYRFDPTGATEARGTGRVRWLSTVIYPLKDQAGNVNHIVITHRDVSELKNASLEINQYTQRLEFLHKIDQSILGAESLLSIVHQILTELQNLVPYQLAVVGKYDSQLHVFFGLAMANSKGVIDVEEESSPLSYSEYFDTNLLKKGKPQIVNDFQKVNINSPREKELHSHEMYSSIIFPLIVEQNLFGTLELVSLSTETITLDEMKIANEISKQLALSMSQWELRDEINSYTHELETKIAERTAQLEFSNKELRDFAQIVSHDLKAPLRAISQLSYWISKDYADKIDAEGQNQLEMLTNRVKRLDSLIDGILLYSRAGKIREKEVNIDLNKLIEDTISSIEPPASISVQVQKDLPNIVCDQTRIGQVFQNLIDNAIKYMDKPKGLIEITCEQEDEYLQFCISDNGMGIAEKYFDRIFQIFQRLSARDEQEGTGVGLSLVKRIVQIYGGQIWLTSDVGIGTKFYFTLPKKPKN